MSKKQQNIAILGAGIMGLAAASALRGRGHRITIHDPAGFPADNASAVAGGMLAPYSEIEHMDVRWVEMGLDGIAHWRAMDEALCGKAQLRTQGSLLIAHNEDRYILERFRSHLPADKQAWQRPQDYEAQLPAKFAQGLFLSEEAHLNPQPAINALIRYLRENGVHFAAESAAPDLLAKTYDYVVDCRGMGADDPQLRGVKGEIALVRNTEFSLSRPVRLMHPRYPLYIVPRPDHVYMIGATMIESEGQDQPSLRSSLELLSALYALHPSFGDAQLLDIKAGIRPAYADNLPRLKINGAHISCNGLFRHGFLLSPIMGVCVADAIAGRQNKYFNLLTGEGHDDHHHQRREEKLRGAA